MLVYNQNNVTVDFNLEVIPAYFTIKDSQNNVYEFDMDGRDLKRTCPMDTEGKIKFWIKNSYDEIRQAVWDWNLGKNETKLFKLELDI